MNDFPINDVVPETVEDRELEELLAGAFDAPPVPRSLLKRLDSVVEQEWGLSPRLADSSVDKLQRGLVRGSRWLRRLPMAAAAALLVIAAVMFYGQTDAYAWSTMLDALSKRGVVQLTGDGLTRWLSLNEGLVSESSADAVMLLNLKQHVALRRGHKATTVERLALTGGAQLSRDQLAVAFLLGPDREASAAQFEIRNAVLVMDESWQEVSIDGKDQIELSVRLNDQNQHSTDLKILLDPQTHLPLSCDVTGDERTLALSYSDEPATARVAAEFPQDLHIVDVQSFSPVQVALSTDADVVAPAAPGGDALGSKGAPGADASGSPVVAAVESPLFGAASKWQPVALSPQRSPNIVQDLDTLLQQQWAQNNIQPVAPASDEELLRRVYLDLAGRTPSVTEVRNYLKDQSPGRYETLVNKILNSPDHTSHLAARFRSFLIPEGVDLTNFGGIEAFEKWLAGRFQSNESYDKTVQSLLLAEGRLVNSGPLLFYTATKLEAEQLAGRTARVFLGMRLECAQCHDHPFEPWSQQDFWGFAAFFARISRPNGKLENASKLMQVRDVARGEVMLPESKTAVPPKFLNSESELVLEKETERRRQLTTWLTGKDNPYFARATANRVWSMLFGKGIVNPVDDFGLGNKPISPELLDLLAGHFIQSEFNLKELFRVVALSRAYRLSSGSNEVDETRQEWFAQMNVKMLTAEQVYDCITVATMPSSVQSNSTVGIVNRFNNAAREEFLREFRTPSGRSTEYQGGIPQALTLMNGGLINGATGLSTSGLLKSLEAPFFTQEQRIEIIYFATLSRSPKPTEKALLQQYITPDLSGAELREALSDILWAQLNSAEFTMNH